MRDRGIVVAVLLVAAVAFVAPRGVAAQDARRERALYVSVLNDAGAPVPDLGPSDFIVREDNAVREVLRVQPADAPMQVAILVDNSTASRDNIAHFRTALPPFVTMLTEANAGGMKNQVAIIAIGERPTILTDYTSSAIELKKGIDRLWALPGTGAYLLDGIVEVSQGIKKREAPRPVIVAITAEGTEFSSRHYQEVLEALRNSGAAFHALVLGQPSGTFNEETHSRNVVLDEGTRTTGGSRDQLLTPMAVGAKLKQLADQLTHQYLVTYGHPESLIPPEHVTVAASKPGLTARGTLVKAVK